MEFKIVDEEVHDIVAVNLLVSGMFYPFLSAIQSVLHRGLQIHLNILNTIPTSHSRRTLTSPLTSKKSSKEFQWGNRYP
jgi:hypothetical protein